MSFVLLLPGLQTFAQDQAIDKTKTPGKTTEKTDLNTIDFEQVEDDWESNPKQPAVQYDRGIRVKEIIEPSSEYSYASFGRPDPFLQPEWFLSPEILDPRRAATPSTIIDASGKEIPITSPLQAFQITDLTVRGMWQLSSGEKRAIIATPKGEGVVVKPGDPISTGKVMQIERERLVVRLYRLRADGIREFEDVDMPVGIKNKAPRGVIRMEPGQDPVIVDPADPRQANPAVQPGVPGMPAAGGPAAPMGVGGLGPAGMPQPVPGPIIPAGGQDLPAGIPNNLMRQVAPAAPEGNGRPGAARPGP